MSERPTASGRWVVLVLLAAGVVAGIAGVKYRKLFERPEGGTVPSATTQSVPR
jgi:hypothetical protein